jgi:hypothetical protein
MLEGASGDVKAMLGEGDLLGSGHLTTLISRALQYDPKGITLPEALSTFNAAIHFAQNSTNDNDYSSLVLYLEAGWKLGKIRQKVENLPGRNILFENLQRAENMMKTTPIQAIHIGNWCNTTSVQQLAADIQGYQNSWELISNAMAERDLKILEGIFDQVKQYFWEEDEENSQVKLNQFKQRLDQLGIQIPEPILPIITSFILLVCCSRKPWQLLNNS